MSFWKAVYAQLIICAVASPAIADDLVVLPVKSVPHQMEPGRLLYAGDAHIYRQVTVGLLGVGDGFKIDPLLAESVEWKNEGRMLRIKIGRHKFYDGSLITTDDVIKSLERCFGDKNRTFVIAEAVVEGLVDFIEMKKPTISGLKAIDEQTIEVALTKRSPLFLDELSHGDCNVIKPSAAGSLDVTKGALTSGPYKFESLQNQDFALVKNPHYGLPMEGPERVIFRGTPDMGNFEKLKSWGSLISLSEMSPAPQGFRGVTSSELGTIQLVLNNAKGKFANLALRRALAQALDYGVWAQTAKIPLDRLQAGLIPMGMPGFKKRTVSQIQADRPLALKALRRLGYTKAKPFRFSVIYTSVAVMEFEAKAWLSALKDMPIQMDFEFVEPGALKARLNSSNFEAMRVIKFPGSVEPHRLLTSFLSNSGHNISKSKDPKCDQAIKNFIEVEDLGQRIEAYGVADRCLMSQAVVIPMTSLAPITVLIREPWKLKRSNQYLLFPYWVSEWKK